MIQHFLLISLFTIALFFLYRFNKGETLKILIVFQIIFLVLIPYFSDFQNINAFSFFSLVLAYEAVLLLSLGYFIGEYFFGENYYVKNFLVKFKLEEININQLIFLYVLVWSIRVYRGLVYGIFFSGSGDEDTILNQSYLAAIIFSYAEILSLALFFCAILIIDKNSSKLIVIIEFMYLLISNGRRGVILAVAILFLVLLFRDKVKKLTIFLYLILISLLMYYIITPFFLTLRNFVLSNKDESFVIGILRGLQETIEYLIQDGGLVTITEENLSERPSALKFLLTIIEAINSNNYLLGQALSTMIQWTTPSVFVDKPIYQVEQYIQTELGLSLIDDSISWYSVGYADAGLIGCFLSGLILFIILKMIILTTRNKSYLIKSIGFTQIFFLLYNIEGDPFYVFVTLRNLLLLSLILKLISIFKNKY